MNTLHDIAVAHGDGIGPEIMDAVLHILHKAEAPLKIHPITVGYKMYQRGILTGIDREGWEILHQTKAFLKAPLQTPQGGGYRSVNVTIRTTLGLYANVRPAISYAPFVPTKHPEMDVVVIRENEEDLYIGVEYQQTADACYAQKMISYPGCMRILHYAFTYARKYGRKKISCFTKDNIMKLSDGLFHQLFEEISAHYPEIETEHYIVDIGMAKAASSPEIFDVIVLPNLYGDILSDITAQISGSIGLAGSANIGEKGAMFEAIHGCAPRRAGKNCANPSGLLLSAISLLNFLEEYECATLIHNGWMRTIEEGVHTYDLFQQETSRKKVSTTEFAEEVCKRLGQKPQTLTPVYHQGRDEKPESALLQKYLSPPPKEKQLDGVDVYITHTEEFDPLLQKLIALQHPTLALSSIYNRGSKIWPEKWTQHATIEHYRCRFLLKQNDDSTQLSQEEILSLLQIIHAKRIYFTRIEFLCSFDQQPAYSL